MDLIKNIRPPISQIWIIFKNDVVLSRRQHNNYDTYITLALEGLTSMCLMRARADIIIDLINVWMDGVLYHLCEHIG